MIAPDKLYNALYALQGVLIRARAIATEPERAKDLAALLDYAEHLPSLIGRRTGETARFRATLTELGERYQCAFILQRFDEPVPLQW